MQSAQDRLRLGHLAGAGWPCKPAATLPALGQRVSGEDGPLQTLEPSPILVLPGRSTACTPHAVCPGSSPGLLGPASLERSLRRGGGSVGFLKVQGLGKALFLASRHEGRKAALRKHQAAKAMPSVGHFHTEAQCPASP